MRFFKKKKNVKFENPKGRPKIDINKNRMLLLKRLGKSNREIAKILGVSEATIRRRLKEIE